MDTYCVGDGKYMGNNDPKIFRTKNNRHIMKNTCSVCGHKKVKFIKKQEASR